MTLTLLIWFPGSPWRSSGVLKSSFFKRTFIKPLTDICLQQMYRWKNTVNVHWRYRWLCNPWTYVDHIYLCKQAVIYELLCISLILQHNALLLSWQLFSCLIYTAGKIISTHSTLSITSPTSPLSSCSNGPVSVWFGGGGNTVAESHTHSLAPLQERHQGGCGERGKRICPNVAHCWKMCQSDQLA